MKPSSSFRSGTQADKVKFDTLKAIYISMDNQRVQTKKERFRAMAPMYYRGASAAILVYDITSEESFTEMTSWMEGNIRARYLFLDQL